MAYKAKKQADFSPCEILLFYRSVGYKIAQFTSSLPLLPVYHGKATLSRALLSCKKIDLLSCKKNRIDYSSGIDYYTK